MLECKIGNNISLVKSKSGRYTLKIKSEDCSIKTLHSLYDPVAEAKSLADSFECVFSGPW